MLESVTGAIVVPRQRPAAEPGRAGRRHGTQLAPSRASFVAARQETESLDDHPTGDSVDAARSARRSAECDP